MRKIGGDFEFDKNFLSNKNCFEMEMNEYSYQLFDSGRSALMFLLKKLNPKKVILPSHNCVTVVDVFKKLGIDYNFYKINKDLSIDIDSLERTVSDCEIIFLLHYFGKLHDKKVLTEIKRIANEKSAIILEDTTHSYFTSKNTIGDYCIASLRKWFAIPDCGLLYSLKYKIDNNSGLNQNLKFVNLRKNAMEIKNKRIFFNSEQEDYLEYYVNAENYLDTISQAYKISDFSKHILQSYNFDVLRANRKRNFQYLQNNIKNTKITKIFEYKNDETYIYFPVFAENRNNFRKYLFKNQIFCGIHWTLCNEFVSQKFGDTKISDNILSLIIDQRFSEEEMKYICEVINKY